MTDYKNIADELLLKIVKTRVPEIPIDTIDDSNRKTVIAVLRVTDKIRQQRQAIAA